MNGPPSSPLPYLCPVLCHSAVVSLSGLSFVTALPTGCYQTWQRGLKNAWTLGWLSLALLILPWQHAQASLMEDETHRAKLSPLCQPDFPVTPPDMVLDWPTTCWAPGMWISLVKISQMQPRSIESHIFVWLILSHQGFVAACNAASLWHFETWLNWLLDLWPPTSHLMSLNPSF